LLKVKTAADIPRRLRWMQAAREIGAAASTLFAYLTTVLPKVRRELRQLGPLPEEKVKNAEAVAVFATLAPGRRRGAVVRAIIALQVAIDLRDESEERDEVTKPERLDLLESRWCREAARLPAFEAVRPHLERAIERCEKGQRQTHRAAEDPVSLQAWAEGLSNPSEYRWWEVAAGASSSVAAHALLAAAASEGTSADDAAAIDAAYNPPIGALTVLLDDLVDREADRAAGEHNYLGYYESNAEVAERLGSIADRSEALIRALPHSERHRAILAGVAAFYLSSPQTAPPVRKRLLSALGPGTRILVAFMRLRRRRRSGQAGNSPGP
jgi:tetraprenyl-beta-curcumene synthase